ncbi:MAG TPA: sensor histidine kinase [Flavihumibacter sp.]
MNSWVIAGTALGYLILLALIAWAAEKSRKRGRSVINNGYVYALSMAVYCTAWTYYGSVGRAATNGMEFLTIYLGPTIMCAIFWPVLRKIIRICRTQGINSMADFISTRYGKNFSLAVIVTICCVLGVIPYIALQLKAITTSFDLLSGNSGAGAGIWRNSNFYGIILLTIFILFFGTRSVDASERHEGLVAAIAFESIIKLLAFLAAGLFICYGIFGGVTDIFRQAAEREDLQKLFVLEAPSAYSLWFSMLVLSMLAIIFLPRQFQVNVVENLNENHLRKASWLFPLYLFVINLFVLPIALGGSLLQPDNIANADLFVLSLPLSQGQELLSLFIFVGGFSAATGMIIVETIALTTMISNNLALPALISTRSLQGRTDRSVQSIVLWVRRGSILLVVALAVLYDEAVAQQYTLVSTGLVSFAAVAQLAPAVLGGLYWKAASKNGALAGLIMGFSAWIFTLLLPSMAGAGLISNEFVEQGYGGINWLKPTALFGLSSLDPVSHSLFWSLLLNCFCYVAVSLNSKKGTQETYQAEIFVDIFRSADISQQRTAWKDTASLPALRLLLQNFVGQERADRLLRNYAQRHQIELDTNQADPRLVSFTEKLLSGVIGSASAHIMVSSVAKAEELSMEEIINMLRESQQNIELNRELRRKSSELTKATEQLSALNRQLMAMDELKDEFLYTVTHEIRTPLTSIRALTELVHDHPTMPEEQREQFLSAVIRECERLSHLITQVLNLERFESGKHPIHYSDTTALALLQSATDSIAPLAEAKSLQIKISAEEQPIRCDKDLILQVLYNLLSNAVRYTPEGGRITVLAKVHDNSSEGTRDKISRPVTEQQIRFEVRDTGKGIPPESLELVFDKFYQAPNQTLTKPEGSGLGLAISKKIIELHGGQIHAENLTNGGACFIFVIPALNPVENE